MTKQTNHSHTSMPPFYEEEVHEKAGYSADTIETYVKNAEMRFQNEYDVTQRVSRGRRPTIQGSKCRRPSTSDSESSNGMDNEFSSYMQHDQHLCPICRPLPSS